MSRLLLRVMWPFCPMSRRAVSCVAVTRPGDIQMDSETRDRVAPKIGNRDVVGYGVNGNASYWDSRDFPCSAIRYTENAPEFMALREKEKGDWKTLSIEDKKALYRHNFCQTYAEMDAPTGQLKTIIYIMLGIMTAGSFINMGLKQFFYSRYPLPKTINAEWQEAMLYRMVDQQQGKAFGVASKYDYENERWRE